MNNEEYIVYHYCKVETFKNILISKVLWLSDLTDSNDEEEVVRTFVHLWEGAKKRIRKSELPKEIVEEVVDIIDKQYKVELLADPPYGICFCKQEDVLSQWNEYGDHTRGVSLGFDINWFIKNGIKQQMPHPSVIQSNAIGCEKVRYHKELLEKNFAEFCIQTIKDNGIDAGLSIIRPTFKHYSAFIKNPKYEPEDEIRIVYYSTKNIDFVEKNVDVSDLKTNVKRHFEIPWCKDGSQALKSICLGHNCTISKEEIKELLAENGICNNITITESECSYRIR